MPRRVIRRTINAGHAAPLTPILEQVVERGTAKAAKIDGYTIAGKTGTAQKLVNGRYSKSEYNASFVGFLPSRQPRVDDHRGDRLAAPPRLYGGVVAAPLFKTVAEATLRHLGVPPNVGAGAAGAGRGATARRRRPNRRSAYALRQRDAAGDRSRRARQASCRTCAA